MRIGGNAKALALEILVLAGLLIFSRGFLPPTRTKLGFSTQLPEARPKFDRIVFMVVDAMRSDFLFSESKSHMNKVHALLREGHGYAFTAFSDPPTVTLPRIKGLTTGASPNFLDAVINIAESDSASTLQNQDSWIHQLHSQNKSLHMFGDDTWLKLFPNYFEEFEGTSSFYVADFTQVDNNVTRHLPRVLPNTAGRPWDALILHYLGLDHIGHKGGPTSIHMPKKLEEMDSIVQSIYNSLDDRTLFVLTGDHGMNDVGNHGGASQGETSAALAFFAKSFNNKVESPLPNNENYAYYSKIYQVDIVPTLAVLLGFPIPKNSLGVFIQDFLPLWDSPADQNSILRMNCRQLDLAEESSTCNWSGLKTQQVHLMRSSSQHIITYMVAGIAVLIVASIISFVATYRSVKQAVPQWSLQSASLLTWLVVVPLLYFLGMMGSSTVEEEHYIWYWALTTMVAQLIVVLPDGSSKLRAVGLLASFRIIRGWNTAGQKWNALTDMADLLNSRPTLLYCLVAAAFAYVSLMLPKRTYRQIVTVIAAATAFAFKIYSTEFPLSLPWMIKLARISLGLSLADVAVGSGMDTGALLLFMNQTKLENIPLWIVFALARKLLIQLADQSRFANSSALGIYCGLVALSFEYASFFAMGGSNSLATVDLSNAYNGVSGYNIPLVSLLTYLGNWSAPLYWTLGLRQFTNLRIVRSFFYSIACSGVAIACLVLREHLFIWTVFSPKLLYVIAWLVFHEIVATSLAVIF